MSWPELNPPETKKARAPRPARSRRRSDEELLAQRVERNAEAMLRRAALRELLKKHNMTASAAARHAGMPNANLLYNFLRGTSSTLSVATVSKLASVFPDLPSALLLGHQGLLGDSVGNPAPLPAAMATHLAKVRPGSMVHLHTIMPERDRSLDRLGLQVRMEAGVGSVKLRRDEHSFVGAPLTREWAAENVFAVRVRNPGAEEIYGDGSLLVCLPIAKHLGELTRGRRVILSTTRLNRRKPLAGQVTVRELVADKAGLRLDLRGKGLDDMPPVYLPRRFQGDAWVSDGFSFKIEGLVVMACIPETA